MGYALGARSNKSSELAEAAQSTAIARTVLLATQEGLDLTGGSVFPVASYQLWAPSYLLGNESSATAHR